MSLLDLVPAPGQDPDWAALCRLLPDLRALDRCPQDPVWHAEGDVGIHTRMVLAWLCASERWRSLPLEDRQVVFLACLLHDIAKPAVTRTEDDGRITSRGHSRRGASVARVLLWELDVPFAVREAVCGLVLRHQLPFYLIDRPDLVRQAVEVSLTVGCARLALVAEADALGREAADRQRLVDNVGLFREHCAEAGILDRPWPFDSDHQRFLYFHKPDRDLYAPAWDDTRAEVVLMSGLPGAGKDTWVSRHAGDLPVVSLDALREALEVDPTDAQGAVIQAAREQARVYLRQGQPFVWNATNLSRELRGGLVDLCTAYKARVRVVYCEAGHARLWAQNRERAQPVPESVIQRLLSRWVVPEITEAHRVEVVIAGEPCP